MGQAVEDALDEVHAAMRVLRAAMKGIPAEREGFKGAHDRLARDVAKLSMVWEDTDFALTEGSESK